MKPAALLINLVINLAQLLFLCLRHDLALSQWHRTTIKTTFMTVREDILVVDDKPDNLRLLSSILTSEGYKVRKALNGRLAIEAARLEPPHLILLDIMMPQLDGYHVFQQLQQDQRTCMIPVIFLSALDTVTDKVKAFTLGGVDYITKPFQQEEVLARVKTHLQIRSLTQTLQVNNRRLQEEIEQRQQAEAELKQALQELKNTQTQMIVKEKLASLGALMAGIAHELRNPLNFVNNYAESSVELVAELIAEVETTPLLPEQLASLQELLIDVRDNASSIHQHGQRAERIIQSMMQHARTGSDDWQVVPFNNLLKEAVDLVYYSQRSQLGNLEITIQTDYDTAIGNISVIPADLTRAFINLISNAFYAIHYKWQQDVSFQPTLWLKTRKLPDHIEVRIHDNGIGIEPEAQQRIFDPFFTTKTNEGTGLGLSITYDVIVEQHRGRLSFVSEPGIYTEFIVILPV
jgi:signal transduction histidine kinase